MKEGTKRFVSAIFSSGLVFLVDIFILGLATSYATTSRGLVSEADLADATKLYALLNDETFAEFYRWGDITLEASTAFFLLFLIIPATTFIITLVFAYSGKRR